MKKIPPLTRKKAHPPARYGGTGALNNEFDAPQGLQPILGLGRSPAVGASVPVIGANHSKAKRNRISLPASLAVVDVAKDEPETRKISYRYYSYVPLE